MRKIVFTFLLFLLILFQAIVTFSQQITTITVSGNTYGIAVNPNTKRLYVLNTGSDSVSVIDTTSNSIITTIKIGNNPFGVAVNPNINRVYTANTNSDTVSVINGSTNEVISTISLSSVEGKRPQPTKLVVNPNTNKIYVSNRHAGKVSVIDGEQNKVIADIKVTANPEDIAVNPLTNKIYISDLNGKMVYIIDGSKDVLINSLSITNNSSSAGITVNPNLNKIYLGISSGGINVIDGSTDTLLPSIAIAGANNGFDLEVNPKTNILYYLFRDAGITKVAYINTSNDKVEGKVKIENPPPFPNEVAVDSNTEKVYICFTGVNSTEPLYILDGSLAALPQGDTFPISTPVSFPVAAFTPTPTPTPTPSGGGLGTIPVPTPCVDTIKVVNIIIRPSPVVLNQPFSTKPVLDGNYCGGFCEVRINFRPAKSGSYTGSTGGFASTGRGCGGAEFIGTDFIDFDIQRPGSYPIKWSYFPRDCGSLGCAKSLTKVLRVSASSSTSTNTSSAFQNALGSLESVKQNLINESDQRSNRTIRIVANKINRSIVLINKALEEKDDGDFDVCDDNLLSALKSLERAFDQFLGRQCRSTGLNSRHCIPKDVVDKYVTDLEKSFNDLELEISTDSNLDGLSDVCN